MHQGRTEDAFQLLVDSHPQFEQIREKVLRNLGHPVEFVGKNVRGIIAIADTIKNAALEPMLDALRIDEQRQAAFDQRMKTFNEIPSATKSVTTS